MMYSVDCSIYWGSKYVVEADSENEAVLKAQDIFIRDYSLNENPNILGLGIDSEVEELDGEDKE